VERGVRKVCLWRGQHEERLDLRLRAAEEGRDGGVLGVQERVEGPREGQDGSRSQVRGGPLLLRVQRPGEHPDRPGGRVQGQVTSHGAFDWGGHWPPLFCV